MNHLLTPPSLVDLIRVLKAWRFWMLGAIFGAILGAVIYYIAPPPFRAQATVNVDFNLEQAWPQETDRQQFYYLEREARKLEETALSDDVMDKLSSEFSIPVEELRGNKLQMSQPAEAGWHFFADDNNPQLAASLASAWARTFVDQAQIDIDSGTINEFVRMEVTQSANLPIGRRISLGEYLLAGSICFLTLAVFMLLFLPNKNK